MTMTRKTITVTKQMDKWIKSRVKSGIYGNDSEYVRDLVRRDEMRTLEITDLRQKIQDGLDSGLSEKTPREIFAEAKAEYLSDK